MHMCCISTIINECKLKVLSLCDCSGNIFQDKLFRSPEGVLRRGGDFVWLFLFWGFGLFVGFFLNKYTAGVLHCLTCDSCIFTDEGFKNICWQLFFSLF